MSFSMFGSRRVDSADKPRLVRNLFNGVARHYDLMNDMMSFGLHRLWKRHLIDQLCQHQPRHILDLASGTGDIAYGILDRYDHHPPQITLCDASTDMMAQALQRHPQTTQSAGLGYVCAQAEDLPFAEQSFDLCVIAFGIRNFSSLTKSCSEIHRVLAPGGQLYILELGHVDAPILKSLYDLYSLEAIPRLGRWIANNEESYRYLVDSIRSFPGRWRIERLLHTAGFSTVHSQEQSGGLVNLYHATLDHKQDQPQC